LTDVRAPRRTLVRQTPQVLLVGFGRWGANLARALAFHGALYATCDTDPAAVARACRLAPGLLMRHWEQAIPHAHAVCIATPPETHFQIALDALEMGKHVFVEKPMTLDYNEASTLTRVARDPHRTLMVGHILAFEPYMTALRAYVSRAQQVHPAPLPLSVIATRTVSRPCTLPELWWVQAPHDVWCLLSLLGTEDVRTTVRVLPEEGTPVGVELRLDTPYSVATLRLTKDAHTRRLYNVYGTGFELCYSQEGDKATLTRADRDALEFVPPLPSPPVEPLIAEMGHFLRCIETKTAPETSGERSLPVMQVLDYVARSLF
jgi:predicted dehydrogenase